MSSSDLRPYLDELERFADGQMSASEQEAFELRMEQDEALSAAYEVYERFTADLRWVAGHETLRHRLQALDHRLDQRQEALLRMRRQQRRTQVRWALTLAGLLLAVGLGLWLWLRPRPISADEAWARYYSPDAGLSEDITRRTGNPLLTEAMRQYRAGHYPAALHSLRRIPETSLGSDTLLYYTGIILLRQDEATAARSYLNRASRQPSSGLAAKARYHLGMAQWRTGQLAQAQATLRNVAADSRNPYQLNAQQVLQAQLLNQAE